MSKSSIFRKLLKIFLIQSLLWLVKGEKFVFPFGNGTSDTDLLSAENDWEWTYEGMGQGMGPGYWHTGDNGNLFCSFDLKLSREIRFGSQTYDTIFACASGYIYFGPRYPDPFFPHATSSDLNEKARMIPFMHEVRMDWDENRYDNHLFFRELSSGDLQIMAGIVTEHADLKKRFEPDWGFVVTWDEIEDQCNSFAGARNSFQAAVACDGAKTDKNVEDDDCYVMYDFYRTEDVDRSECNWGMFWFADGENFARSGFKDGQNVLLELPLSGTIEVRNLFAISNIDVPGVWLFKIGQNGRDPAVSSVNPFDIANLLIREVCHGEVSPKRISNRGNGTFVTIPSCSLPAHDKVELIFRGTFEKVMNATYVGESVTSKFPTGWEVNEQIQVFLRVDDKTLLGSKTLFLYSPIQTLRANDSLRVSASPSGSSIVVNLQIDSSFSEDTDLMIVRTSDAGESGFELETQSTVWPSGSTTLGHTINSAGIFTFFTLVSQNGTTVYNSLIVAGSSSQSCSEWDQEQSARDVSRCLVDVGRWYGCPQRTWSWWRLGNWTDADFAHEEVRLGISGWQYDICCNDRNPSVRDYLDAIGYCSNLTCEFNPGANLCIRSPKVSCYDGVSRDLHSVSNQCCYNSTGDLILPGESGAGSLDYQVNSIPNMASHLWSELDPYEKCCIDTNNCDLYYKHRPTVIGSYWPRNILIGRGDPDIQTVDGLSYPFMGLGVFTMLKSDLRVPTTFQVSTRRVGNGTVFSGFVITHNDNKLECAIYENATFESAVNGEKLDFGDVVKEYTLSNISVKESDDLKTFTFEFVQTGLVVRVVISQDFLNLMISVPPTFKHKINGLMGYYDGNTTNDFTAANGTVYANDTDHATLHYGFGESYRVAKDDWLFASPEIIGMVESDIANGEPFTPVYEATFESEEQRQAVMEACKNDNACILDVALTGNMSFAVVFAELESEIEEASQASELFRESEPEWANWEEEALEEWGHSGGEKIVGKLSMVIMALFATLCLAIH